MPSMSGRHRRARSASSCSVPTEVQRVQMDICWQTDGDTLLADVKAALTAGDTPYSVEDVSYDPDYAAMRAIVQLEVL